ncbi:MAG: hypothetical protein U5N26_02625 [Candidatus Marinimicrobia bacterium]|nr:hypothetical protein [Candidatus Neomarinimicrobiota bacterium]
MPVSGGRGRRVRHGEAKRGITENHERFAFDPDLRARRSKKTNGDHAFDAETEAKMICLM